MTPNKHKVPSKLWKKFSNAAEEIYNDVMNQALPNQAITVHPASGKIPKEHWETICHNMACYAAWAFDKKPIKKGDVIVDTTDNGKEVKKSTAK